MKMAKRLNKAQILMGMIALLVALCLLYWWLDSRKREGLTDFSTQWQQVLQDAKKTMTDAYNAQQKALTTFTSNTGNLTTGVNKLLNSVGGISSNFGKIGSSVTDAKNKVTGKLKGLGDQFLGGLDRLESTFNGIPDLFDKYLVVPAGQTLGVGSSSSSSPPSSSSVTSTSANDAAAAADASNTSATLANDASVFLSNAKTAAQKLYSSAAAAL